MFESLLVANRGEIARRIFKTARRMGLRTVAVYSDADADAPHVRDADVAINIGSALPRESYLRADRIVDAALQSGADAIHPGYGFLSEQPELVEACLSRGIGWVGPKASIIRTMGSKIEAKSIAAAAGAPLIPGYAGDDQSDARLFAAAEEIGYPLMVKASAGGGGKGMRAVGDASSFLAAVSTARTEALRYFGDGALLLEKLIERPRHVEVQVLGDQHGHRIHLFDRDCSVQRNHQKVLEEAPAPGLSNETRTELHKAALRIADQIDYDSVGTVEFILDPTTEEFFFLEMNTRLQVEHTVTEAITGIDLVEWQIRVAAGEPLGLTQDAVHISGHAIEARITAEDAAAGFVPGGGLIHLFEAPAELRVDAAVETGTAVGLHYDSLIAKIVAHAPARGEAIGKLARGLEHLRVVGPMTTRSFLRDAVLAEGFRNGTPTTHFIKETWPTGWTGQHPDADMAAALAYHLHLSSVQEQTPWTSLGGFRILAAAGRPARSYYLLDDRKKVRLEQLDDEFWITVDDRESKAKAHLREGIMVLLANDRAERVRVVVAGQDVHLAAPHWDAKRRVQLAAERAANQTASSVTRSDAIIAPAPGLLVEVRVREGDHVQAGQTLAVLESMKLMTSLASPSNARVRSVRSNVGSTLSAGTVILDLDLDLEREPVQ
jgi:acetyl/propionyl-CoA carboxylase alpha subunit